MSCTEGGDSNILSDWNRLDAGLVEINDLPIQEILSRDDKGFYFSSDTNLQSFFKEQLLCHVDDNNKTNFLQFMLKTLHQGGLLNPVSAAFYEFCASNDKYPHPCDAKSLVAGITGQQREIKICAVYNGFTVHEILTQNPMVYPLSDGEHSGKFVFPDQGQPFVLKAEARLSIIWNQLSKSPKIHIDQVGITFGHEIAKKCFDNRWFYQKWIDNAWYYSGYNVVSNLSPSLSSSFMSPINSSIERSYEEKKQPGP